MVNSVVEEQELNRLRWQCRRGMLELDLLLQEFLEQHYSGLDKACKREFTVLLEYPDQLLQNWLFAGNVDVDARVRTIVDKIRQGGQEYEREP